MRVKEVNLVRCKVHLSGRRFTRFEARRPESWRERILVTWRESALDPRCGGVAGAGADAVLAALNSSGSNAHLYRSHEMRIHRPSRSSLATTRRNVASFTRWYEIQPTGKALLSHRSQEGVFLPGRGLLVDIRPGAAGTDIAPRAGRLLRKSRRAGRPGKACRG